MSICVEIRRKGVRWLPILPLVACLQVAYAGDYGEFTGQKKAACEAFMCLTANNGRPSECKDSLKKYYKIQVKNSFGIDPKKTKEARKNFLKICPSEQDDKTIESVIDGDTCKNAECSDDLPPPPPDDENCGKFAFCEEK